jgi:hypothetical protein
MEIAEIAQYERPAWGVPGTHVSGIINMHNLVRKKPRVRASGPLVDPGARATPVTAIRRASRDPTDDRTVPQKHSLVQRNDQYSRKIPTKAPCQIGPATIRRYGRPNAAGRALSLGYVSLSRIASSL